MAAKKQLKKDLEAKIAELEEKLAKLSTQVNTTPESKPAPKPAETKPAKGTLPKGFESKPAPKPAETKPAEPEPKIASFQEVLENEYMNAQMTDFHQYRAKVTGYSPAANRYFVRRTAPVGKVPTANWNEQKAKVPGYTQPSNQYFATRARLSYSPPKKTFGGFSGSQMTVESGAQVQEIAVEPPKPAKGTMPKGY